jgi:plasmid stabilization system protein ParE
VRIRLLSAAEQDLLEGYRFYEGQRDGLGDYFLSSLYSDIESLRITAGVHLRCFDGFHRLLSKRFPFAIYYRLAEGEIRVFAVLDTRRSPAWTRRRMSSRSVP